MPVRNIIKPDFIGSDTNLTWANSAPASTAQTATFTVSNAFNHKIVIYNPSTITDLTVKVYCVQKALGGVNRDSLLTAITTKYLKTQTTEQLVSGMDGIVKIVVSNDTALGVADGFTATVRLIEL